MRATGKDRMRRRLGVFLIAAAAALVVGCGGSPASGDAVPAAAQVLLPSPTPTEVPVADAVDIPTPDGTETSAATDPDATGKSVPESEWNIEDAAERSLAVRLKTLWCWDTNFTFRKIGLLGFETLLPRDRIVPIDDPAFVAVKDAPEYVEPREPVIMVAVGGEAKAYPLAMLMWHEIVNDTVGGLPVTITFCPLCNAAITFERVVDGQELTFGTSGMLRNSDLVMWDRQTQSWWQQFTGEALVGDFAGTDSVLTFVPSSIIAWDTFAESYPDGLLMERLVNKTGHRFDRTTRPRIQVTTTSITSRSFSAEWSTGDWLPHPVC